MSTDTVGSVQEGLRSQPHSVELRPSTATRSITAYIAIGLLALSAGSGELYGWPRLASLEGTRILWLLIPAAILQIPVLVECQRVALLTGRSFFAAVAAMSPVWGVLSVLMMMFSFLWLGGWLSGSAAMIAIMMNVPEDSRTLATNVLTTLLAVAFGWPLLTRQLVAKYVSTMLKLFAIATFAMAVVSFLLLPDRFAVLTRLLSQTFTPHPDVFNTRIAANETDLILAITFLGLGSWASTLFTGYASLQQYGRSVSGSLWAPAGDTRDGISRLSLVRPDDERLFHWYRHIWRDVSLGVALNLISTALLTYLAVSVLFGSGQTIGTGYDLLSQQARFFEGALGDLARPLFIIIASAFLLDTWVGFIPFMAKGAQECVHAVSRASRKYSEEQIYRTLLVALFIQTVVTTWTSTPGSLIRLTAISLNVTHPIVIGLLIALNYRYLPTVVGATIRPSRSSLFALVIAFLSYTALAVWYLTTLF